MTENKSINFLQQHLWWMLLLFIVVLQIPFLLADPDFFLSHSRDAHSDEGLNTIQLRNYINHGYLDPWECDNLMKNPLFNLILYFPFLIFGTKLLVARLTVLIFVTSVLFLMGLKKPWRQWIMFVAPLIFLQFHVFQYMHFSLAEMMSVACILMGMFGLANMWDEENLRKKLFYLLLGLTSMMFAWFMKIQFVYVTGIAGVYVLIYLISDLVKKKKFSKHMLWVAVTSVALILLLGAIYYKYWYLHYKGPFEYIMKNQTGGRFHFGKYFWNIVAENFNRYFTTQYVMPVWIACLIALPVGIWCSFKVKNRLYKRIFIFSLIWFLVELHKISIHHVPSRYLLSQYASMLTLTGTVLFGLCHLCMERSPVFYKNIYKGYFFLMILLVGTHLYNYTLSLQRRRFHIQDLNNYMNRYNNPNMVVIGPWAPTVTWNTQMRSLPVWKDFLNFKDIKNKFHPDVVVMEPGEADSDGAFCADNFDVVNESDSVVKTWIGKWPVHIYWMRKDPEN